MDDANQAMKKYLAAGDEKRRDMFWMAAERLERQAAELERLQAIASAFFKIVSPDGFHQCGFNEECPECGESETHADDCKLAAALSPRPGVIGDES
jgi:hypothetical protein